MYLEINNNRFEASDVCSIVNALGSCYGDVSSNVKVVSNTSLYLLFDAFLTFKHNLVSIHRLICFDAKEQQIILPTSVNLIKSILKINSSGSER